MTDSSGPLFLVGPLRSGTTLLRLMLDHHPDVYWPGEFEYAVNRCQDVGWPDVAAYRRFLATDRMFLWDELQIPEEPADYVTIVRSFLDQHRERGLARGKRVLGVTVHSRFDRLPEIWPDARFIHLNRDPRDVARSCIGMGWVGNVYYGVEFWTDAEQRWEQLSRDLRADQFLEVRYDELIQDPERTLRSLCRFMGVDYSPRMLDYHKESTYEPPDASLVGQWRRKLGKRDIQRIEARAGELLVARGYEPSGHAALRVGWVERTYLFLHNRIRRARTQIERLGVGLWLQRVISQRVGPESWRRRVQLRTNEVVNRYLK